MSSKKLKPIIKKYLTIQRGLLPLTTKVAVEKPLLRHFAIFRHIFSQMHITLLIQSKYVARANENIPKKEKSAKLLPPERSAPIVKLPEGSHNKCRDYDQR